MTRAERRPPTRLLLLIPATARLLEQAPPPAWGWFVAFASAPAILLADRLDKLMARRCRGAELPARRTE